MRAPLGSVREKSPHGVAATVPPWGGAGRVARLQGGILRELSKWWGSPGEGHWLTRQADLGHRHEPVQHLALPVHTSLSCCARLALGSNPQVDASSKKLTWGDGSPVPHLGSFHWFACGLKRTFLLFS